MRLDALQPSVVIQGGCPTGADALARAWATDRNVECWTVDADWEKYGSAAGPIRNAQMLEETSPDLVLAFPGGRGTADMVKRAKAAGVQVVEPIK